MKFTWERETSNGVCQIFAEPGPYDGYPYVSSLIVDSIPRTVSSDRLAVVSVLAFGKYLNGPISFPNSVSPATAEAISTYLSSATVHVENIDFEPRAIEYGPNVFSNFNSDENSNQAKRIISFSQPDIWDSFGSSFETNKFRVPTNSKLLDELSNSEGRLWDSDLAALVLLSEDYGIGSISVRGARRPGLSGLLQSCGISLIIHAE